MLFNEIRASNMMMLSEGRQGQACASDVAGREGGEGGERERGRESARERESARAREREREIKGYNIHGLRV